MMWRSPSRSTFHSRDNVSLFNKNTAEESDFDHIISGLFFVLTTRYGELLNPLSNQSQQTSNPTRHIAYYDA